MGNGGAELFYVLFHTVRPKRVLLPVPSFSEYERAALSAGAEVVYFSLREEDDFHLDEEALCAQMEAGDCLILGSPNNPTGQRVTRSALEHILKEARQKDVLTVVDESFMDFCADAAEFTARRLVAEYDRLVVVQSLTKFFAIPGLRLGFAVASQTLAERMDAAKDPWNANSLAQAAGVAALADEEYQRRTMAWLGVEREFLFSALSALSGVKAYPPTVNFILLRLAPSWGNASAFCALMRGKGILLRDCSNYPGLDAHFIRIGLRRREDNLKLLAAVRKILSLSPPHLVLPKRKPALMIQGTCSNAGKSVLCAAFCRILLQDGYAVAPFKAQNMSLNSAVTPDGGEIGRAQAVQAEACRIDPDVRMNPILLKPNSELGSQVILLGKPVGNFKVRDYFARKKELWNDVKHAYDSLAANYDCMVLEGAGSPGEINLKKTDVVNMRMAQYAAAPVLLAGDIDRGGVYASFIGTYATFEPWERELLYGFAVNKFRGDPTLLDDTHKYVARMTGKEVAAVFDFLPGLGLPEEDSVGFAFAPRAEKRPDSLDIAVVRLGHIANFTDFAPLDIEPDVQIRVVERSDELGEPDVILLPGSKSVAEDISRMHHTGLFDAIARSRAFLVGICGGLQILGEKLLDPDRIESDQVETAGLGLLPLVTRMDRKKTLLHTAAATRDGLQVRGYEIHHGVTVSTSKDGLYVMHSPDGRELGYEADNILATYLHGIFDDDAFRRHFLNELRRRKGWGALPQQTEYGFEPALNRLADHVRSRIDLKKLYRKMGL